jgi:hypothetical protein
VRERLEPYEPKGSCTVLRGGGSGNGTSLPDEEMMGERGVAVDHATLNRWVIKYAPEFEKQFRRRQCLVGRSWRMDETYVKIKGKWAYLYRAVLRSVPSKWWRHQR